MEEAKYWISDSQGSVQCSLCPRNCKIAPGEVGYCHVRKNVSGKLYSLVYGKAVAVNIDPIEKKPLFHFYPGQKVFSFGTVGCNLRCKFCQNWEISQTEEIAGEEWSPEDIVDAAVKHDCKMIAATYNEPTIFFEYMIDCFKLAKKEGLKTVVVSNGFINPEPLKELIEYADAFNIDLKSFDNSFYVKETTAWLEPVKETIKTIKDSGRHLEVTNLVIPGKNDDCFEELTEFVSSVGKDIPLHFSAFVPMYKTHDIERTKKELLDKASATAEKKGITFVYEGNVASEENTICPGCGIVLVSRTGFHIIKNEIREGKCPSCNEKISGEF